MRSKRKHVKKFQDEQYKIADARIKEAAELAAKIADPKYPAYVFWPLPKFKRYHLI